MTQAQVAGFRLRRHHLVDRAPRDRLADVVGDVGGVQAQVTSMARIALWARLRAVTVDDVERALLKERLIVKVWSLRGALHLHPARDLPVALGGIMATRLRYEQRWIHREGLREEKTTAMVLKALATGPLTRAQLSEYMGSRLGEKTKGWRDGGWGRQTEGAATTWHLVKPAIIRGLVCFGPSDGQEVTFTRVDRWLREPRRDVPEAEAEEALVRGYLGAFGPADAHDLRMWAGIHMRPIRAALERLRDELVEVDIGGRPAVLLRKDLREVERGARDHGVVNLLPSFDPFMLGHADRRHLLDRAHYPLVYKDQGWLAPVVLRDGRVAGTWSHERKGRVLAVAVNPFARLSKETRDRVEEEARDLSRFLGAQDVFVRFTSVQAP